MRERAKLTKLVDMSVNDMKLFLNIKKQKREKKNEKFETEVINIVKLESYLQQLKDQFALIPDGTRFQLALHVREVRTQSGFFVDENDHTRSVTRHWDMIDFYIKDGKLHTLILDAALSKSALEYICDQLKKYFPDAENYVFFGDPREKGDRNQDVLKKAIQTQFNDCQTFTYENMKEVAKLNPDALYNMLAHHCSKSYRGIKGFRMDDLTDEMCMIAPLFRSMQSNSEFEKLPASFKKTIVSRKKNKTFSTWFQEYKKRGYDNDRQIYREFNQSIRMRDEKYLGYLNAVQAEEKILPQAKRTDQHDEKDLSLVLKENLNSLKKWEKSTALLPMQQEYLKKLIQKLEKDAAENLSQEQIFEMLVLIEKTNNMLIDYRDSLLILKAKSITTDKKSAACNKFAGVVKTYEEETLNISSNKKLAYRAITLAGGLLGGLIGFAIGLGIGTLVGGAVGNLAGAILVGSAAGIKTSLIGFGVGTWLATCLVTAALEAVSTLSVALGLRKAGRMALFDKKTRLAEDLAQSLLDETKKELKTNLKKNGRSG